MRGLDRQPKIFETQRNRGSGGSGITLSLTCHFERTQVERTPV